MQQVPMLWYSVQVSEKWIWKVLSEKIVIVLILLLSLAFVLPVLIVAVVTV